MSSEIVGESVLLRGTLDRIRSVAPTDVPVLITGESGVGKELVARAVHASSAVAHGPLVRINCAAVPRELFESEFFGHARGSFTGARDDRIGRFECARDGSLFLDEVSEIPLDLQGKLLRVLQEGEFERVGESTLRRTNARIIAASNRDLREEVEAGRFRQDLYYRLSAFPVQVPALRERQEDIPCLADHFVERACTKFGRARAHLRDDQLRALVAYTWPGNVRELKNEVERAVLLADEDGLHFELGRAHAGPEPPPALPGDGLLTFPELRRLERRAVLAALRASRWKVSGPGGAAHLLEVKPTTLASRMKAMGIERPR